MPRELNSTQPYQDKLVKLIPTEIVGAYMVLAGILGYGPASESSALLFARIPDSQLAPILIQVVFGVLLVLTPFYLRKVCKVSNWLQIGVTMVSFVVWVYTLGGPFVVWGLHYTLIATVALVLWSLIPPLLVPVKKN